MRPLKKLLKFTGYSMLLMLSALLINSCNNSSNMTPPKAKKIPHKMVEFGNERIDNYYWLNQRTNPEVIKYLEDENAYLNAKMAHTKNLQKKLYDEMVGRIVQDDESVPYLDNEYFYYTRYEKGKEHPIYCRKKSNLKSKEIIILDVNKLAAGHKYYKVSGRSVSTNNEWLAFGVDTLSRRIYTIHFKNLKTGEVISENIPNTTGYAVWANDNKTLFYSTKDSTLRPFKIFRHTLGTDPKNDTEIYTENDPTFRTFVTKSKSGEFIFIGSSHTLASEYRFINANKPYGKFKIIQPRIMGLEYSVAHFGNYFYIKTNLNAENFKLVKTPINKTNKKYWKDVISHRKDVLLDDFELFKKYLVLAERANGTTRLRVISWDGKKDEIIKSDEDAYTVSVSVNKNFNTNLLRYNYTSLTTPSTVYDYNMDTKEKTILKQAKVLGGYNPADYKSEKIYAIAKDGVKIPISIVYKKGLKKDGNNPALIYGYGSYGASMDPYFSSARLSLLDRGFVYAIAHIRGGQEMGRWWYEQGKMLNKKNTFTDFIACSKKLIEDKFTNSQKLAAMGGSAGGLLMGAIINMSPETYKAVIAAVPFVDVVTTMLDESIPLTTGEYDEWGNPNIEKYYRYILSYSPYDNVEAKNYPALLVTTGLHDSQVQYWEPAKWVAKLREMKTDKNLLLLHTNMSAGHGGSAGRFERYKEIALEYAFIIDQVK